MPRPYRSRALAAVFLIAAAGCQDYNFNPVGHCVLQPGTQRFTLSNVSSADVLFVVDDSGSMAGEQQRLADAFSDFVENLTSTNRSRAQGGLLPLDFHVAVTTSSIFVNREPLGSEQTCSTACAPGKLACCVGTAPVYGPRRCTTPGATTGQCPVAGTACRNTCDGLKGELYCCAGDGSFPPSAVNSVGGALVECQQPGVPCGSLKTHYDWTDPSCTPATRGVSLDGLPYPDGEFVGSLNVAAVKANPRVLHFDKRLYLSSQGKNAQGFSMQQLQDFFRQNVQVGTCGSPQEQGFEASRRAIAAAFAGTQRDTYDYNWTEGLTSGVSSQALSFTAPSGIPTPGKPAKWPNQQTPSKLVVVYVGDEDDCSSPKDPAAGVRLLDTDVGGHDACARDATETGNIGGKQFEVSSFVDYLTGLGRPVGAAFVVSARANSNDSDCRNDECFADICCDRACTADLGYTNVCAADVCGGQAPGTRFVEAARQLKSKGADVVVGSVCGDFKPLLREVAEIVKPPQTLTLPTEPAESAIAILRIASSSGVTRKVCGRPLKPRQPTNYTRQEAEALGPTGNADWWFVADVNPGPPFDPNGTATVAAPSKFVYINPKGSCIANPGETYSADYLGVVPAGGCSKVAGDAQPGPDGILNTPDDKVLGSADCQAKMGGRFADWECYVPTGLTSGTCTCRSGG